MLIRNYIGGDKYDTGNCSHMGYNLGIIQYAQEIDP